MTTRFSDVLELKGGQRSTVSAKTAAYTATISDDVILCDATAAAFSVTLPSLADAHRDGFGMKLCIAKTDASANAVTVDAAAAETINGAATLALAAQYDSCCLVAGSDGWYVISLT